MYVYQPGGMVTSTVPLTGVEHVGWSLSKLDDKITVNTMLKGWCVRHDGFTAKISYFGCESVYLGGGAEVLC